jgi:DNA-binding SARP family transcriptional activator
VGRRATTGARGALHSAVQRLRSTLGPSGGSLIETRPPGYLITVEDAELDIREFSVLAARGHAAAEAGTWGQAASMRSSFSVCTAPAGRPTPWLPTRSCGASWPTSSASTQVPGSGF